MGTIKFKLKLKGEEIDDIDELKEYCECVEIVKYFRSNKLTQWLKDRDENEIADAISNINYNASDVVVYSMVLRNIGKKEFKKFDELQKNDDEKSKDTAHNVSAEQPTITKTESVASDVFGQWGRELEDIATTEQPTITKIESAAEPEELEYEEDNFEDIDLEYSGEYSYDGETTLRLMPYEYGLFENGVRFLTQDELALISPDELLEIVFRSPKSKQVIENYFGKGKAIDYIAQRVANREYKGDFEILIPTSTLHSPTEAVYLNLLNWRFDTREYWEKSEPSMGILLFITTEGNDYIFSGDRLVDLGGAIVDRYTGLMWEFPKNYYADRDSEYIRYDSFSYGDFNDAALDKAQLQLFGFNDWRLPDTREIKSADAVFYEHYQNAQRAANKFGKNNFCLSAFWTITQTEDCKQAYYYDFATKEFDSADKKSGIFTTNMEWSMAVRQIKWGDGLDHLFIEGDEE